MMGTRHDEAVIVSWWSAVSRRYCQWCLTLASGAVSHGVGAVGLRFNCARLSLDVFQVRTSTIFGRSTQSDVGGGPLDSDRRGPMMGTRHDEAVIVSW